MSVAIYVRTSTDDNDGRAQLAELTRVAGDVGTEGLSVYLDRGESGTKASRPEWDNLLRDCRNGLISTLYATEISRLGRSLVNVVLVLDELARLRVDVVLTRQGIDYRTPVGRCMAQMLAAFAQLEREQTRERTAAGIAKARASGTKFGRPERSVDVARARELRARGHSWRQVSRTMGVALGTLTRAVKRTKTPTKKRGAK